MPAISSTFESNEPSLHSLLDDIHVGKIQLPDFQRPWRWDDNHIVDLLASISQSYPVGAVMLLDAGGSEVRFRPRTVEGVELAHVPAPASLILDGQQRLTSLYMALRSGRIVKTRDARSNDMDRWYYFDMVKCLDGKTDREEAILSLGPDRQLRSDFGRKVELDVTTRTKEYEADMVPTSVMLDSTLWPQWRLGYMQHFGFGQQDRIERITRFETEVQQRFVQFKVPVIKLLRDTPKEAVCQVFEKVNTGGVSLTVFELVTASFAADNFNLRDDWNERREKLHEIGVLEGFGEKDFLQGVTLLASYRRHVADPSLGVSCKKKDMLRLGLAEYKSCAGDFQEGLLRAAKLANLQFVLRAEDVPYLTQFVPLGAVCAQIGHHFDHFAVRERLAQWYWCGVFGELYGGTTETRFANDMEDLCDWVAGGDAPRSVKEASFMPTRLLSLQTRNSAAYKGMMALMVATGSRDFINGDPIVLVNAFQQDVDIHHIFPRAWCEAAEQNLPRSQWNSIVNKGPLTSRSNRLLGGDAPSLYLARIVKEGKITDAALDEVLKTHLIDPELLRANDFKAFILNRASKLLDLVQQATGKPVLGRDAEATVAAFGGSLV